jgi:predicted AlkP superfamily pyrophosphatase or phosphodiesterase
LRPRLIVLLVLDQFRFDYLTRFRPQFAERGFNLVLEGADFVNCHYDYATTLTCAGHATLITGSYPSTHGIVANEWFDPSLNRTVACVEDAGARTVGAPAGTGVSPRTLVGSTIGDELRMATGFESRVFAAALKDRSAVVMGGHLANAAYWLDLETGRFVTSDYYASALPAWVEEFNAKSPTAAYCGKDWLALSETPGAAGKVLQPSGTTQGAPCPDRNFHEWLRKTPFMAELELAFAAELAERERLGKGPATDLLGVSVGSIDYIGHAFGPYSAEMADTILRTDRLLADFFARLDRLVGLENTWIILTADHGAPPTPQFAREHRLSEIGPLMKAIPEHLEKFLSAKVGAGPWVASFDGFTLNLNRATLARHKLDAARAAEMAAEALKAMPGIHTVFRREELQNGKLPRTPVARKAANSFHARRSGDLLIIPEPFAVPSESETETMHGSPWTYDTHVPLILWGSAFKPGTYVTPCKVIDLVPTLTAPLGVSLPAGSEGRPLSPALK